MLSKNERGESIVDAYLEKLWVEMMDSRLENQSKFEGAINLAFKLGIFTEEKCELWRMRVEKCPCPEHVGNRDWCAYCGDVNEGREVF